MKIGLPRAMLYHRYRVLWETFFKELGCDIVTSDETNKKILSDGINFSIDECCLPSKIYMGHVYSLIGRCDYILIPRILSYRCKNDVCVKFNALYDIICNTFKDARILDYNIDSLHHQNEKKGFVHMGRVLGFGRYQTLLAYNKAKKLQEYYELRQTEKQNELLRRFHGLKILVVSHPYNTYDKLIGAPVVDYIKKLGGMPVFADLADRKESTKLSKEFSNTLTWVYNQELIGSIKLLEQQVDGVILLTAFPCGPDSLVNELVIRKNKNMPTINIILDELQGEAGLQTRIESFMDILSERKSVGERSAS